MSHQYLISIVDDDESVRNALCGLVRSMGHLTQVFPSAEAFLQSGAEKNSDCIVTDVHMPGMCGEHLQKALGRQGSKVPLIVMTAFPDLALRDRVLAEGAFCFMVKPFDANEMIRCIEDALRVKAA